MAKKKLTKKKLPILNKKGTKKYNKKVEKYENNWITMRRKIER